MGYNYRLAEPLAVIARANLARFDDLLDRRRSRARHHLLCRNAATVIDRTLAVVLTDHDEQRITGYAQTISREARRWNPNL